MVQILEDFEIRNKLVGVQCLRFLIRTISCDDLHKYGFVDVFFQVFFFPNKGHDVFFLKKNLQSVFQVVVLIFCRFFWINLHSERPFFYRNCILVCLNYFLTWRSRRIFENSMSIWRRYLLGFFVKHVMKKNWPCVVFILANFLIMLTFLVSFL